MTPNWKFSQRDMRKMLADRLVAMRKIRSEVLVEGKVGERKQAYLEQVVQAESFVDALDCPDRTEKLKETMMNCFNEDYSLSRYDVTQDKWWATDERWMSFVLSMRKLAFYFLRGGLNSTEDAFHFFQIMKQLYETEREERKDEMFMQPAYGAIFIPNDNIGPLIRAIAKNRNLIPIESENMLALKLDWYPDDNEKGMEEVKMILEKAAFLGYTRVEFWLSDTFKYEKLNLAYSHMQCRREDKKCIASIRCDKKDDANPNKTFQLLESDNRFLNDVKSELNGLRTKYQGDNGFSIAACTDDCGMEFGRMLFAVDDGELAVRGGLYLPQKTDKIELLMKAIAGLKGKVSADSVDSVLTGVGNELNAMLAYANIRRGEQDEQELEAVGDSLGV